MTKRICLISGCNRPVYGHGWCSAHYSRWKRWGNPETGKSPNSTRGLPEDERFWRLVKKSDSCCVRPCHLRVVSAWENNLRSNAPSAWNAAQTHCKRGHPFTSENTRFTDGHRVCRACQAALANSYRAAKRKGA